MKHRIILFASFCFIFTTVSFCRTGQSDSLYYPDDNSNYYYGSTSLGYYFPVTFRVSFAPGYSSFNDMKLSTYSKRFFINVNYSISTFFEPLDYSPSQVGFYNEIGLYNTSLYLNLGPELRLEKHFYLIPYLGMSVIPFSKYKNDGLAFTYYLGAAAGFIINLNNETDLVLEAASDFMKFKKDQNNLYFKMGLSYNLFYPL